MAEALHGDDDADDEAHERALEGAGVEDLMVVAGARETLRRDAVVLDRFARAAGVDSALDLHDDMFHDFMLFPRFLREGQAALEASGRYVAARSSGESVLEK